MQPAVSRTLVPVPGQALFIMVPPSFSSPQPCAGGFGVLGAQLPLGCLLHPAVGVFQRDLGAALSMSICSLVEHHFCTLSTVTLIVSFPEAVKNTHAGFFSAGKSSLEIIFLF